MARKKKLPQLTDVSKKHAKIIGYLLASTFLGRLITYITNLSPEIAYLIGPAINYVAWVVEHELKNEGLTRFIKPHK